MSALVIYTPPLASAARVVVRAVRSTHIVKSSHSFLRCFNALDPPFPRSLLSELLVVDGAVHI